MLSFDVVSLFTKVPIADVLETVSDLLSQNESLGKRTAIPAEDICALTELCLWSTYLEFQGGFYEQVDGAAMGSTLPGSRQPIHGGLRDKSTGAGSPMP